MNLRKQSASLRSMSDSKIFATRKAKVIAVSGYFDPLHVGHIEYHEMARGLGGKLIVIVNNDKQAELKK